MLTLHRLIHHLRHPARPCQNLVYNETFLVVLANPQTEVNTNFGAAEELALPPQFAPRIQDDHGLG